MDRPKAMPRNNEPPGDLPRGLMKDRDDEERNLHTTHADRSSGSVPELGPNSAIGRRLKAYYDDVASEPVPDRFLSLLDALDLAESASKKEPASKKSGRE